MSYTSKDFQTKKALREAVKNNERAWLRTFNPSGLFPTVQNGTDVIEGPQYPKPHRWYASVRVKDGYVVEVTG